jgi:hypothetical protein
MNTTDAEASRTQTRPRALIWPRSSSSLLCTWVCVGAPARRRLGRDHQGREAPSRPCGGVLLEGHAALQLRALCVSDNSCAPHGAAVCENAHACVRDDCVCVLGCAAVAAKRCRILVRPCDCLRTRRRSCGYFLLVVGQSCICVCLSRALSFSLHVCSCVAVFLPSPFAMYPACHAPFSLLSLACPAPPSRRYTKGEVEIQLGLYKEAFLTLRQALQLNPQVRDARSRLMACRYIDNLMMTWTFTLCL